MNQKIATVGSGSSHDGGIPQEEVDLPDVTRIRLTERLEEKRNSPMLSDEDDKVKKISAKEAERESSLSSKNSGGLAESILDQKARPSAKKERRYSTLDLNQRGHKKASSLRRR